MDVATHVSGSFCTAVLRTQDMDRAAAFYAQLVGWTSEELAGTRSTRVLGVNATGLNPCGLVPR